MFGFRRNDKYPLRSRMIEVIEFMKGLAPEQSQEVRSAMGRFIAELYDEYLIARSVLAARPATFRDLPGILNSDIYDGLLLLVGDRYKEGRDRKVTSLTIAALFPMAALQCLHPEEVDPVNVLTGQLAADICDHSLREFDA
jgi:hypothetical protein